MLWIIIPVVIVATVIIVISIVSVNKEKKRHDEDIRRKNEEIKTLNALLAEKPESEKL